MFRGAFWAYRENLTPQRTHFNKFAYSGEPIFFHMPKSSKITPKYFHS